MKKKLSIVFFALVSALCLSFGLIACGDTAFGPSGAHVHGYQWVDNGDGTHKQHCAVPGCDAPDVNTEDHVWGTDGKCEKCKAVKPAAGHTHDYKQKHDGTDHWMECSVPGCTEKKKDVEPHNTNGEGGKCTVCGYVAGGAEMPEHSHEWSQEWEKDETHHWHECTADGCPVTDDLQKDGYGAHDFTNGDCICGKEKPHSHEWSKAWQKDETHHWHECTADGCPVTDNSQKDGYGEHSLNGGKCACGYEKITDGLEYALNSDKTGYYVNGIGTATDTDIYVASVYNGLPVTAIGSSAFINRTSVENVTLPDGIKYIEISAFSGCTSLKNINIPEGVAGISNYAFKNCSSIENITLPDGIIEIGYSAFEGCSSLKSIVVGEGLKNIWKNAFTGCSSLKSATLPNSLVRIGDAVFSGCPAIESVTVPFVGSNGDPISKDSNGSTNKLAYLFSYYDSYNGAYMNDNVPKSLKRVTITRDAFYSRAFNGCRYIEEVNISAAQTVIPEQAFSGCLSLKSIEIPNGVTSIRDSAFRNCRSLADVDIPESVKTIYDFAFAECTSLTSIYIGLVNTNTSTDRWFYGDNALTVYLKSTRADGDWNLLNSQSEYVPFVSNCETNDKDPDGYAYTVVSGVRYRLKDGVGEIMPYGKQPSNLEQVEEIVVDSTLEYGGNTYTVEKIPNFFSDNFQPALKKFTAKEGIKEIDWMLSKCANLSEVSLPNSLEKFNNPSIKPIAEGAPLKLAEYDNAYYLGNATNPYLVLVCAKNNDVTSCEVHANTKIIGGCAFYNRAALASINISTDVKIIGNSAFKDCSALTTVNIPSGVTTIDEDAFYNCNKLETAEMPSSVTYIGGYAFCYCNKLKSITLPSSVKYIGDDAFHGCSELTTVEIPSGVEYIGGYAFYDCSKLQYNEYGNAYYLGNATNPYMVFVTVKDSSASSYTVHADTRFICGNAFAYCGSSIKSVTIPNGVVNIGRNAFSNCNKLTSINFLGTKAQWLAMNKESSWNGYTGNYTVTCSDGTVSKYDKEMS